MKATIEFNLPEENEEFSDVTNGVKYKLIIQDIMNNLRAKIKYEELKEEEYDLCEKLREEFFEIIEDYEVNIY